MEDVFRAMCWAKAQVPARCGECTRMAVQLNERIRVNSVDVGLWRGFAVHLIKRVFRVHMALRKLAYI